MHDPLPLLISLLIMMGMLAQWVAWRVKVPSILFLLVLGVIAGPVTGAINPDVLFDDLLFPMVSLGVALVLFEGALTLKFADLKGHGSSVSNLVTWGAVLNWALIAGGAWWFVGFDWSMALLFGALVVVTGPTVIMPLLRTVRPTANVSNILRWEGILIDPLGALFAVIVFEVIISGVSDNPWLFFFKELAVGFAGGALGALCLSTLIKRHWLPEYLHNIFTLGLVLTVFSLSNQFAPESGLLAVTVMGIWLANTPRLVMHDILSFKESLSILIISVLFIVLAARVDIGLIIDVGWGALGVLAVILLARPVMVFASTWRSGLNWREKALLSWIAPRGIVAAAVSALFALRMETLGFDDAALLPALTFMVIIFTVLLQSVTSRFVARMLGVAEEEPRGILIAGGNPVAIAMGKALKQEGFRVKIASSSWNEVQSARMQELDAYFGSPVSAHADRNLDLVGIGRLFAMSMDPAFNALVCLRYRTEFGRNRTYVLRNAEEKNASEKDRMVENFRAPSLFGEDVTVQKLASLLSQDAEIKSTSLSETFALEDFQARYGESTLLLFAIDPKGRLRAYTDDFTPEPGDGWTLVFLLEEPQKSESKVEKSRQRKAEQEEKNSKKAANGPAPASG
jgi:NhaP-type Na+/H+ or K+/H+ antiporter